MPLSDVRINIRHISLHGFFLPLQGIDLRYDRCKNKHCLGLIEENGCFYTKEMVFHYVMPALVDLCRQRYCVGN